MKKSFTLFSTLILIFIFSILLINIFEVKSLNSINIKNQHQYIQAKNHLMFLEEYINIQKDFSLLEKLEIENSYFDIFAKIKKIDEKYEINLYVSSKNYDIRLHKRVLK